MGAYVRSETMMIVARYCAPAHWPSRPTGDLVSLHPVVPGHMRTYARRNGVTSLSSANRWRHRLRCELWERQPSSEQSVLPMNSVFSLGLPWRLFPMDECDTTYGFPIRRGGICSSRNALNEFSWRTFDNGCTLHPRQVIREAIDVGGCK